MTLDFPLPHDFRPHARRRAWRIFEIGVLLSIGAIIWFGACSNLGWHHLGYVSTVLLGAGLIALVLAALESTAAWSEMERDDDLRQLSVAGHLLIRTARDHHKQVWYRNEIRAFQVHERRLILELNSGEWIVLIGDGRTDLEWIETVLRQSLAEERPSEAIMEIRPALHDRITPDTRAAERLRDQEAP